MKILHINLCGPVTDNWTYQDNLLTKYHYKIGHEVTMIASQYIWDNNGKIITDDRLFYTNDDGVKFIRLKNKFNTNINSKFKMYHGLLRNIIIEKPDIIFVHGVQFLNLLTVLKYIKRNPNTKLYIDNHADLNNSAKNFFSKWILHKLIWKFLAQKLLPYTEVFYGVMPSRVLFLQNIYSIPSKSTELLLMGADDEYISKYVNTENRMRKRRELGINDDTFLIVTGGKIDSGKKQTMTLIKAVNAINNPKIKLLIFGSIDPRLTLEFEENLNDNIVYIGWISGEETYEVFNIADLVCFPGGHSVFWEQTVAIGRPLLIRQLDGVSHLDFDGNVKYIQNDSLEEIKNKIIDITTNEETYNKMKRIAQGDKKENFYYSNIAKKSINHFIKNN